MRKLQKLAPTKESFHPGPLPSHKSVRLHAHVDGSCYHLRLQLGRGFKVAALQAVKIDRRGSEQEYTLITGGQILSALLELYLYQNIRKKQAVS